MKIFNQEQVWKKYLSDNAPFFGVFGVKRDSKFFAVIDKDLRVLYETDKVFDKGGNFTKQVEGAIAKHKLTDKFRHHMRTDDSLLRMVRSLHVTASLQRLSKTMDSSGRRIDTTQDEVSPQFEKFEKQIRLIGYILDRDEYNKDPHKVERYGDFDTHIRSLYTAKGIDLYEEALAWENLKFNDNILPFMEELA